MKVPSRSAKAFTLVELLVVISIVSLLVAILLPSLSAARESANQVVCLSQTRQLHLAHAYYAQDFVYLPLRTTMNSWNYSADTMQGVYKDLMDTGYLTEEALKCPSAGPPNDTFFSNYFSPNASIEMYGGTWSGRGGNDYDRYWVDLETLGGSDPAPIASDGGYRDHASSARAAGVNHRLAGDMFNPAGMNLAWADGHGAWVPRDELHSKTATTGNWRYYWFPADEPRLFRDPNHAGFTAYYFGPGTTVKRGKIVPKP